MGIELSFRPYTLIAGSHYQTILGSFLYLHFPPRSKTHHVLLPDRDIIAIEITTPKGWKPTDRTVVMVHGLCGSHKSPYLIRMTKKLKRKKIRAIRVNLRGCGSGRGLSRHIYHGGQSNDILEVLKMIKNDTPQSPITLVGFSLGGSLVLKLAGELGSAAALFFREVIAVSPPVDLYSSISLLGRSENRIYERYFVKLMREDVYYRHKLFPDLPRVSLPKEMSCLEFDRLYTVPHFGFSSVTEYYSKCSSRACVPFIRVPCRILWSQDDPIIAPHTFEGFTLPDNIQVYMTKRGGHMGYLGRIGKNFHWMDGVLMQWISENSVPS